MAYASRVLTPTEANYAPTEGELLALVWAVQKFREYLHGYRFRVRTDHKALEWLATARFNNAKLERWAMKVQEYDFEVEYLKGKDNTVADHLSRATVQAEQHARAIRLNAWAIRLQEFSFDLTPREYRVAEHLSFAAAVLFDSIAVNICYLA